MTSLEGSGGAFFCYLGPSIRGVIQTGAIVPGSRDEVEAILAPAIQRYPGIRSLLVSGDTLAQDRIDIRTPGTYLHAAYRALAAGATK